MNCFVTGGEECGGVWRSRSREKRISIWKMDLVHPTRTKNRMNMLLDHENKHTEGF